MGSLKEINSDFGGIIESATIMGDKTNAITEATKELTVAIEQANKAIAEIDSVTQQNAGSAEESASAAEEMNAQAEKTKALVEELLAIIDGNKTQTLKSASGTPPAVVFESRPALEQAVASREGDSRDF